MAAHAAEVESRPSRRRRLARRPFHRDGLSLLGLVCLVVLLGLAAFGPVLPIRSPDQILAGPRLSPPAGSFWFGTDALGRSMLPRIVEGVRNSFLLAFVSVLITAVLATILGTLAGYRRGFVDALVSRSSDVLFAFPTILLALLIAAVIGPGETGIVVAIVLIALPLMTRVVRAATMAAAERDFVVAAEVSGASVARILVVHLVPNIAGSLAVQATYAMSVSMLVESGLSFLGLGIQPPTASLGSLVHDGIDYMTLAPWLIFIPGAVLALAILSINLVGDGLRDRLDPQEPRSLT